MRFQHYFFLSALLFAGPALAQKATRSADKKVASKINALDALLGGIDGRASKAHGSFGKRNANVVNTLFGKRGAQQIFGKDTLALLTGADGLKGTLGKGGPIAKGQNLLKSLHTDYKKMGDRKRLRRVETMQKRLTRIKSTTKALSKPRSLLLERNTVKRMRNLRKDVKAMRTDTKKLKKK